MVIESTKQPVRHEVGSAFLFDLDGTLVDSVYQHVLAWYEALSDAGIDIEVWRIHRRIGMSGGLFANALLREMGREITPQLIDQMRRRHAEAFARVAKDIRPLRGAIDLLATLSRMLVPWAVATSGRMETARPLIAALGIDAARVPVITRDQVRYAKPDPDLFITAANGWESRSATRSWSVTACGICSPPAAPARWASGCCRAATARTS